MIPKDEPFFFTAGGRRLFAVWQGVAEEPRAAVLFCHPFGEEKKSARRAFVETARALAAESVASLRFDLAACGDSQGEFRDVRLADWLEDIAAAWAEMARRAPGIPRALVGLRLGAALAATVCRRLDDVRALVLWQPVLDGKTEFAGDLRRVLIQQMITEGQSTTRRAELLDSLAKGDGEVELDGFVVTGPLYRDICGIDLPGSSDALPEACGVVQFSRSIPRIESFVQASGARGAVVDVPPIWIRSDFIPDAATGQVLAREGVLPWLNGA